MMDGISKNVGCIIAVLPMALTVLFVEERWARAEVFLACLIPIIYIIGVALLAWARREIVITATDVAACGCFAFYVCRTWVGTMYPCRTEFLRVVEMFLLYVASRLVMGRNRKMGWVFVASIIVGGCYEALLGASQLLGGMSRHALYSLTGSFLNPGPYSAYLMMALVVGIIALQDVGKDNVRKVMLVAVALVGIMLPATWSRAAFVGLAFAMLWAFRQHYWKYRFLVWGVLVALCVGCYFVKQGSAEGRLITWSAALATWVHSPWIGVGTGGFCHAVAEGMSQLYERHVDLSSAGVTEYAYNILLRLLVGHGIVGVVFLLAFCAAATAGLCKGSRPLFYGMVSLLVFSMFSYPFAFFPYRVMAVMVVAWSESVGGKCMLRVGRTKASLLAVFLAFVSWQVYGMVRKGYEADTAYQLVRGMRHETFLKDYHGLLPQESDNAKFLFDFGKMLREQGRYNDSNAILRRGTTCSADPMFYVLMGNNYRDMKLYGLSEQAYKKAFFVMPNRVYPLYRLMLLYREMGDKRKARETARRIMGMPAKVESPATREMRKEAKEIVWGEGC